MATISGDGTVRTPSLYLPFNGTGTGRDMAFLNGSTLDNLASARFYPQNGTNIAPAFEMVPRGTGYGPTIKAQMSFFNTDYFADATNWEALVMRAAGADYRIISHQGGTGVARPINFQIGYGVNVLSMASNQNVGVGTTAPAQKLEVNGGVRLNTATSRPACDNNTRGTFWVTQGSPSDTVSVCVSVNGAMNWKTLLW